jgi:uncharacterized protein YbjT (DUF2867 family)
MPPRRAPSAPGGASGNSWPGEPVAPQLLLDEMFPQAMADQLNAKGHDVRAVVADPEFLGLPDEDILIGATEAGRALVTANIKDFMPIDARYRAANRVHAGLIMVSSKTFPQNRAYVITITTALDALLAIDGGIQAGGVVFLSRSREA